MANDKDKEVYLRRLILGLQQRELTLGRACVAALAHGPAQDFTSVRQVKAVIASLVALGEAADDYALLLSSIQKALEDSGVS